tara:strand:+ start:1359 stop:2621 length:1263 start_codon:yes stop_codon:yes gene_type:complete
MLFKYKVNETEVMQGVKSLSMTTAIKDVVTISGSLEGGSFYAPRGNKQIANIATAMIDKGTDQKDKYEISDILDSIGAEISFSSSSNHINFTAHCMKKDLNTIMYLIAEQLSSPSFKESELELLKTRVLGNLERNKEDTRKQANIALLRKIYNSDHPNFRSTVDESIELIKKITTENLHNYHDQVFGLGSVRIASVGDVDSDNLNSIIKDTFGVLKTQNLPDISKFDTAQKSVKDTKTIHIPDKTSADVYIGQSIGIDQDHKDYIPLMMAVYILGGNFSARLMQTVRDKEGLTYGIGSSISSASYKRDGYWSIWATFSPELIEKGIKSTRKQIDLWTSKGVSQSEVETKKQTIIGSYKVGMDTTSGLAGRILSNDEKNRDLSYLDDYPTKINSVSIDSVNNAITTYVDPLNLVEVSAGTL